MHLLKSGNKMADQYVNWIFPIRGQKIYMLRYLESEDSERRILNIVVFKRKYVEVYIY